MLRNVNIFRFCLVIVCAAGGIVHAEPAGPHIGYLYPAGGQQGKEVLVIVGGQFLQQPDAVYISGQGVRASVIKHYRPLGNLQKEQREYILDLLKEARAGNVTGSPLPGKKSVTNDVPNAPKDPNTTADEKSKKANAGDFKIPEHPLLYDLEHKSQRQLVHIGSLLLRPQSRLQQNRQIAETLLLKISIDPDALPGIRELRIRTAAGLTNAMHIEIGSLPEFAEMEPNDQQAYPVKAGPRQPDLPMEKSLQLPVVVNGQILPGDIDRFRFHAQAGQSLVIQTHARRLMPYLADAVPGWFQAVVALYDAAGNEIAYADDYRFDPDPVFYYKIKAAGDYELKIHDSIYRGREDFVYRVTIGELPFITGIFPLGGKEGQDITASVEGWNLPVKQLKLDTSKSSESIRPAFYQNGNAFSNSLPYAVDTLPEKDEKESNNDQKIAQLVNLPMIMNGRIDPSGDVDVFKFEGKAGDQIHAEVFARRLNSPLDSLLRLTDASGKVLEWNDDYVIRDKTFLFKDTTGLQTHHADSQLTAKLPGTGTYYLHLIDSQHQGGSSSAYRLHLTSNTPDFLLWVTPSGVKVPAGAVVPVTIQVLRKNGFDGEIEVGLKEAPGGFQIDGGRVPAGMDSIRVTLRAPKEGTDGLVGLHMEGRANINNEMITRPVIAADDTMQAFLYRHMVPAQQFSVDIVKTKWALPLVEGPKSCPVEIPAGGTVTVELPGQVRPNMKYKLQLQSPPDGITLQNVQILPQMLTFTLKAEKSVKPGLADNLVIAAVREFAADGKNVKPAKSAPPAVGLIPAIPIRVIAPRPSAKKS